MRISERDYDAFAEDHFPNMILLRAWADCKIWLAGVEQRLLILVDETARRLAVFEYDSDFERQKDIRLVLHLSDDGGNAGCSIPAVISPTPPGRSASNALSLPLDETD